MSAATASPSRCHELVRARPWPPRPLPARRRRANDPALIEGLRRAPSARAFFGIKT